MIILTIKKRAFKKADNKRKKEKRDSLGDDKKEQLVKLIMKKRWINVYKL